MKSLLRIFVGLAIAVAAGTLAAPWVRDAVYVAHLLREDPPTVLPVPVDGVSPRRVRDTWGAPRPGGREHQGVDIFAPRGTPIRSATRGLVWRIGHDALGGTVVWVLGPRGDLHYYAHLDRIADVRTRQRVDAGDILGYVGNTGNAERTPPHLHYAIYRRSVGAVNPYPLLVGGADERRQAPRRVADPG